MMTTMKTILFSNIARLLTLATLACFLQSPLAAEESFFRGREILGAHRDEAPLFRAVQRYFREVYGEHSPGQQGPGLEATRQEALEAVRLYPEQVNDVLFTCGEAESVLLLAICCDDYELVKALLDAGAIPCPFRACDENLLSHAGKCMQKRLGRRLSKQVSDLVYIAQCQCFTLDASMKAGKTQSHP